MLSAIEPRIIPGLSFCQKCCNVTQYWQCGIWTYCATCEPSRAIAQARHPRKVYRDIPGTFISFEYLLNVAAEAEQVEKRGVNHGSTGNRVSSVDRSRTGNVGVGNERSGIHPAESVPESRGESAEMGTGRAGRYPQSIPDIDGEGKAPTLDGEKVTRKSVKALSLWQPWASLIAIGAKRIETRSWSTNYRGPIVIHAAKRDEESKAFAQAIYRLKPSDRERIYTHPEGTFYNFAITALYKHHGQSIGSFIPDLPLGAAVCVAELVDCVPTEKLKGISDQERAFGNYEPKRFGWMLENIRMFAKPIPMKGMQGLFDCTLFE
jgi:hypothetical protein